MQMKHLFSYIKLLLYKYYNTDCHWVKVQTAYRRDGLWTNFRSIIRQNAVISSALGSQHQVPSVPPYGYSTKQKNIYSYKKIYPLGTDHSICLIHTVIDSISSLGYLLFYFLTTLHASTSRKLVIKPQHMGNIYTNLKHIS